jgi:hypothetical protein
MTGYNGFSFRNSLFAAICTVIFSSTLLLSAMGPVNAQAFEGGQAPVVRPLA